MPKIEIKILQYLVLCFIQSWIRGTLPTAFAAPGVVLLSLWSSRCHSQNMLPRHDRWNEHQLQWEGGSCDFPVGWRTQIQTKFVPWGWLQDGGKPPHSVPPLNQVSVQWQGTGTVLPITCDTAPCVTAQAQLWPLTNTTPMMGTFFWGGRQEGHFSSFCLHHEELTDRAKARASDFIRFNRGTSFSLHAKQVTVHI